MGLLKEFREFAMRGNVIDLAVGVIIGAAFGKIVSSMVEDVIMPLIGIVYKADFTNLFYPLSHEVSEAVAKDPNLGLDAARKIGPVLAWGNFVTIIINFIIVAFCIFLVIKAMNTAKKRFEKQEAAAPPPPPAADVVLLTEIRDLLKKGR